jgi:hypothetical protein
MDGYCYLYEQAYASDRALKRLERFWDTYPHHRSTAMERAWLSWRLWRTGAFSSGSRQFETFARGAWSRALAHPKADLGELLYLLDSAHFSDRISRQRSARYNEHAALFADPPRASVTAQVEQKNAPAELVQLTSKQWDSTRSRRRVQGA